ncbi:MAG: M3 family oligoendopeptidase [Bacillota bacterium]|nr:M3 family oligoendopeptidase [Bacillota bacterium]HOB92130.1 M3 family oligoendopeptidase [Bacillota bacterium]HPZ55160.1 M3 family oligoendopeptidase [Bacillota bacterium]HQD18467.1 M3 family oligoendopeptidase [Bacillota bacterium]
MKPVNLKDPVSISFDDLDRVEKHLDYLMSYEIDSVDALVTWLIECGRFSDAMAEWVSRNNIAFSCDTEDEEAKKRREFDQKQLIPLATKYSAKLKERLYNSPYRDSLSDFYSELVKRTVTAIETHRDENIPIETETRGLVNEYFIMQGKMTVLWNGEEKTLQQMNQYLRSSDRNERERAWKLIQSRRLQDKDALDRIMDQLVSLRHKIALNAGFENYRDYMFKRLNRFEYTPDDCYRFCDAVEKHAVPLYDKIAREHKRRLQVESYRPWDMKGTPSGQGALRPFETFDQLVSKSVRVLNRVDPQFGKLLQDMSDRGCLDLETRKGKRPGGFCSRLPVSETSFIFMNGSKSQDSVRTILHETGHAVHNLMTSPLQPSDYRSVPAESAELASMSMELFTMPAWDEFYPDPDDLKRAQREQLEGIIEFLPWALTVDSFQHWIYLNSSADADARNQKFANIARSLAYHPVDWSGYEEELMHRWKAQLHIFAYPFYYIEYAIAQIGALQLYKNYKNDKANAVEGYKRALALGSSAPLSKVYATAGIRFDFSEQTIGELMRFVEDELADLM